MEVIQSYANDATYSIHLLYGVITTTLERNTDNVTVVTVATVATVATDVVKAQSLVAPKQLAV